ncbi:hypothetical protein A2U01_0116487, partial [Trifolium medium]|nr:hypothetical protein [Trifolium medium]
IMNTRTSAADHRLAQILAATPPHRLFSGGGATVTET